MTKSADAFRTISEVAEWLGVQTHVLRFWESKFTQIKPVKRAGGRRYYRPADMLLLGGIRKLLHDDGLTIKGVQKLLRQEGMAYVADLSPPLDAETDAQLDADLDARIDEDVAPPHAEADVVPFTPVHDEVEASAVDLEPKPADTPEEQNTRPAADVEAPLPSFLRTPTPEPGAEAPKAEDEPGLPYPPLVETPPAADAEELPPDEPLALTEDVAEVDANAQSFATVSAPSSPETADASDAAPVEPVSEIVDAQTADVAEAEETQETTLPSFVSDYVETTENGDTQEAREAMDAAEPKKPRVVNVPDDPEPDTIPVAPSALTQAAGLTHLSDAQRNMIRPLLAQLTTLRDQMASNRRDPR